MLFGLGVQQLEGVTELGVQRVRTVPGNFETAAARRSVFRAYIRKEKQHQQGAA